MDYAEIVLNAVKQIIFFVINLYVIPLFSNFVSNKVNPDGKVHSLLPESVNDVLVFINGWTIGLITDVLKFLIGFLTGYMFYSTISVGFEDKVLKIDFDRPNPRYRWFIPTIFLGKFLLGVVHIVLPLAVAAIGFRFIVPDTFNSVTDVIGQWTALSSGTPNLEYFGEMWRAFCVIVWDVIVMQTLENNVLLFVALVLLFFCCISTGNYLGTEDGKVSKGSFSVWAVVGLLIFVFNFVYAYFNYEGYVALVSNLNSVGMIILLVLLLAEIVEIIDFCGTSVIKLIRKQ